MSCFTADMAKRVNQCIRQVSDERVAALKKTHKATRIEIANRLPVSTPESGAFVSAMQEAVCDWLDESVSAVASALADLVQYVEKPTGLSAEIQAKLGPEVDQLGVVAYGMVLGNAKADTQKSLGPGVQHEIDRRKAGAWSRLITELDRLEARLEKVESDKAKDRRWKQNEIVITSVIALVCTVIGAVLGPMLLGDKSTQPPTPVEKTAGPATKAAPDSFTADIPDSDPKLTCPR